MGGRLDPCMPHSYLRMPQSYMILKVCKLFVKQNGQLRTMITGWCNAFGKKISEFEITPANSKKAFE